LLASRSLRSEVAVAVLIAALLVASVSLQTSLAQESFPVLLGYGGRSYLPFVGGSELVFMVGETLVAYSPASEVVLKLFPPTGGPITLTLQPRSRVTVKTFGTEDVGTWLLELPSGERMRIRVIDPNAPLFGTISVERWSDDQVLLRVQGSSAVGFEAEATTGSPATLRALPGERLTVSVPVPLRGAVAYLMYPDRVTLSGSMGRRRPLRRRGGPGRLQLLGGGNAAAGGSLPPGLCPRVPRASGPSLKAPSGRRFKVNSKVKLASSFEEIGEVQGHTSPFIKRY